MKKKTSICLLVAMTALASGPSPASSCPREDPYPYDSILRWSGDRYKTLGPTGRRIFADRLDCEPGFCGTFGCGQDTPGFEDPLIITFHREAEALSLREEEIAWYPSHLKAVWKSEDFRLTEKKFITDRDIMVDCLELLNTSNAPLSMKVCIRGHTTPLLERFRSRQSPVSLSATANLTTSPKPDTEIGSETVLPRIPLPHGTLEYDAIAFILPDPGPDQAPTLVALQGGSETDPAFSYPREATLRLPDVRPDIAWYHVLVTTPAPRGRPGATPPAFFRIVFDNGSSEEIAWPSVSSRMHTRANSPEDRPSTAFPAAGDGRRIRWRFLFLPGWEEPVMLLTYSPPPGRFAQQLKARKGAGQEVPVVLAITVETPPKTGRLPVLLGKPDFHNLQLTLALAGDGFVPAETPQGMRGLSRSINLEAGERAAFSVVLASGKEQFITALQAMELVKSIDLFQNHRQEYAKWFEDAAPRFSCSNAMMEKAWHYRWFLTRQTMLRPDMPGFSLPVFFSSLHSRSDCAVSTFATPHIVNEVRWLKSTAYAQGQLRALLMQQYQNGMLPCVSLASRGGFFTHWIPAAAMNGFEVNGSRQYLKEVLPLLRNNLDATFSLLDPDRDYLPAPPDRLHTGMGSLPSYDFFEPGDGKETALRLERPGLAAFAFAGAEAMARGFQVIGEKAEAARLQDIADKIREAVLDKMWFEEDAFFYSLRERDDTPARCREIGGFYPFFARLVPNEPRYMKCLESLIDPRRFWTPFPVATASAGLDAFSHTPESAGKQRPFPGNGPAWPYANSIIAEVMANSIRYYDGSAITGADLSRFLTSCTRLIFEDNDPAHPVTRKCYDVKTGTGYGEPDTFQSTYNDMLIRFVGGLVPSMDEGITLCPLIHDLEYFGFRGLPYHGKLLDITWDRPDNNRIFDDAPEGYTLAVNGERIFSVPGLRRIRVEDDLLPGSGSESQQEK